MDREYIVAVAKLSVSTAVAIALLLVSCFGGDAWFRPVAAISLVVVVAPVTLLVAIDTGRVLRRRRLSRAAAIATHLPQLFLGVIACVGAVGGLGLSLLGAFPTVMYRAGCALLSLGILMYGISLLRANASGTKGDVAS